MYPVIRKRGAYQGNFPRRNEFSAEVRAKMRESIHLFPEARWHMLDVEKVPVVFVKAGNVAGMCRWRKNSTSLIANLEFNAHHIIHEWDDMFEDTIPHEVAHMVDYLIRGKSNHDAHWQRVARKLGCTGERTHDYQSTTQARATAKYRYVGSAGTEFWVGKNVHNKIQAGQRRTGRRSGEVVAKEHFTGEMKRSK